MGIVGVIENDSLVREPSALDNAAGLSAFFAVMANADPANNHTRDFGVMQSETAEATEAVGRNGTLDLLNPDEMTDEQKMLNLIANGHPEQALQLLHDIVSDAFDSGNEAQIQSAYETAEAALNAFQAYAFSQESILVENLLADGFMSYDFSGGEAIPARIEEWDYYVSWRSKDGISGPLDDIMEHLKEASTAHINPLAPSPTAYRPHDERNAPSMQMGL